MRAEFFVELEVIAFRKKVQIELGQERREAIRVFDQICPAVRKRNRKLIVEKFSLARKDGLKYAVEMHALHGILSAGAHHGNASGLWLNGADNQPRGAGRGQRVKTEDVEWSSVISFRDGINGRGIGCGLKYDLVDRFVRQIRTGMDQGEGAGSKILSKASSDPTPD